MKRRWTQEELVEQILDHRHQPDALRIAAEGRFRALRLEPPAPRRLTRLVRAALHAREARLFAATLSIGARAARTGSSPSRRLSGRSYSGHASRQSLGISSRLALGEAQAECEEAIGRFPV
ncbi:MAG: hypothetical protein M3Q65_23705 [Chloroflexota bacterium]|nr:hypothetical protein [Chloroflexota bacterium]